MKETNDLAIQTAKATAPVSPNEYNSWENTNLTESMPCATSKTKPLSDEEIENIAGNCCHGATAWHSPELDIYEFARAIEERHGIK